MGFWLKRDLMLRFQRTSSVYHERIMDLLPWILSRAIIGGVNLYRRAEDGGSWD